MNTIIQQDIFAQVSCYVLPIIIAMKHQISNYIYIYKYIQFLATFISRLTAEMQIFAYLSVPYHRAPSLIMIYRRIQCFCDPSIDVSQTAYFQMCPRRASCSTMMRIAVLAVTVSYCFMYSLSTLETSARSIYVSCNFVTYFLHSANTRYLYNALRY